MHPSGWSRCRDRWQAHGDDRAGASLAVAGHTAADCRFAGGVSNISNVSHISDVRDVSGFSDVSGLGAISGGGGAESGSGSASGQTARL